MRVWLLTVGEPLPTDRGVDRVWRTGLLARSLLERGHEVVWWSSAFDHVRHCLRSPVDMPVDIAPRLVLWHLAGAAYRRNVSIMRLVNHYQVAKRFTELSRTQARPDVILSSLPTLELCCAAVDYGATHGVPVALDVRDLWPDVLFDLVPSPARRIAPLAVPWMARQLRASTRGATAILGVTKEFIDWGCEAAGRSATSADRAFPMGYSAQVPDDEQLAHARDFWTAHGLADGRPRSIVCFFGTLGWMFDFDTVLAAARRLQTVAPDVLFVICGSNKVEELRRRASGLTNVLLPGHVGGPEIWDLMRRSVAGLAPYRSFRNFEDNLPNKPIEYLSASLPIVAGELRVLGRLIREHECGLTYAQGDVDGLVDAVVQLARNPSLRASMSERAGRLYADRFVAEQVYGDMAAHVEALAAVV